MKERERPEERCEQCWYWRALGAMDGMKVCHYCIDNHELRKRDGETCLSFKRKDRERKGAYKPRAMQVRI